MYPSTEVPHWSRGAWILLAMTVVACSGAPTPGTTLPPKVSVVTVHPVTFTVSTELPGRTAAYKVAQVRSRVDGIVQSRDFVEGAYVAAGQRLFQIDPRPYQAALDSAQAALQKAQANLATTSVQAERYGVLAASNAVSKQDYDNALAAEKEAAADVAAGKAAVAIAQINRDYTDVVAPIAGRIGPAQVTQGAYVQASTATLMATIQTLDPIFVDLNQASVEGLMLRRDAAGGRLKLVGPGHARVTLMLEDGSTYPLAGTLQFTDVSVDQATGSVTVRALFPNPHAVLLPGMFVRARIEEGVDQKALLVPEAGVTHDSKGQATALVVDADNRVGLRMLRLGATSGDSWVVEGGLQEGERVIVAGVQRVQQGALVEAVDAPLPPAGPVAAEPGMPAPAHTLATRPLVAQVD